MSALLTLLQIVLLFHYMLNYMCQLSFSVDYIKFKNMCVMEAIVVYVSMQHHVAYKIRISTQGKSMMRAAAEERAKMRMSLEEKWWDREDCALSVGSERVKWRRGEVPISAGTGTPAPWTDSAVLANIQPSPCSTTSSTHAATGRVHRRLPRLANRLFDKQTL